MGDRHLSTYAQPRTDPLYLAINIRHHIYYGMPGIKKAEIEALINEQGGRLAQADHERQALLLVVAAAREVQEWAFNAVAEEDWPVEVAELITALGKIPQE